MTGGTLGLIGFFWIVLIVGGAFLPVAPAVVGAVLGTCNASIAECRLEEEFLVDSETHRRFLQQGRYISYGALGPDRPACYAGSGRPYLGNCVPARSGNPPSRGCNPYDHCRIG